MRLWRWIEDRLDKLVWDVEEALWKTKRWIESWL